VKQDAAQCHSNGTAVKLQKRQEAAPCRFRMMLRQKAGRTRKLCPDEILAEGRIWRHRYAANDKPAATAGKKITSGPQVNQ